MTKLFKNLKKKDYLMIILSSIFIIFQVWLELKIPDYMSEITRLVQISGAINDILVQGLYMVLCAFASFASSCVVGYIIANVASGFSRNIREKLFNKVEEFGMEEIKKFQTSSLITRTTNDVTNVESMLTFGLHMMIKAPITAIWAIGKIVNRSFEWTAIIGGAVLILLAMVITLMMIVLPRFKIVQKLIDNINGLTRENLKGIRVIRAFNAEETEQNKFEKVNNKLTNTQLFNQKVMSLMSPMMYLIMNGVSLAIYFMGSILISKALLADKITLFSNMVVFSSYAMQVIMSFLMLAMIFIMYPRAAISADRINEVLNTKAKIKNGKVRKSEEVGTIEFKNVSFKYPDSDESVLEDISFKANKGDTVAIIGSTGSGKSTLVNLIPRFYDVTNGTIYVDGVDVRDYEISSLHDRLGYVPQKAIMFNGTINYNVSYGKKANYKVTDEKIKEAIEVAQAKEFVDKMPKKYDSNIAQGGTNVSGGQKQRLSIARAIARDPEIYIFDDTFSALDYKTDYILRKELKEYTKEATSIIVAQRIGTIKNADKIIVLDKGKMVGMGTHKELLKKCKVYQEIAYSQLSKEELENE
ncbi:MAG: ABC transporter ATP-binding protein/permease [Tenericutes bacterium]|nr:ABC transporter ATP-binding protein/permease [Mycoplasmatota bacterium]